MAIAARLQEEVADVKYVDLWNADLDETEGGMVWPTPAVFVEFETIEWRQIGLGVRQGDTGIRLHVITQAVDHHGSTDARMEHALARLDLIARIHQALRGMCGVNFGTLQLTTSATNHQHEELIEDIERYETRVQERE